MLFRDVIDLITITETTDELGGIIEIEVPHTVFANKKSVTRNEFYQAAAAGLKPEIVFEIRAIEYQDERKVSFGGKKYNVMRTYTKNDELLELICSAWKEGDA